MRESLNKNPRPYRPLEAVTSETIKLEELLHVRRLKTKEIAAKNKYSDDQFRIFVYKQSECKMVSKNSLGCLKQKECFQ